MGKSSRSRTKRLVSVVPKYMLFTVGARVCRQMRSTLEQYGHFGQKSEITRYLQWVRSLLLETLVNSVQISFTFGQMLKSHAIYSGCAHFLQNPRK